MSFISYFKSFNSNYYDQSFSFCSLKFTTKSKALQLSFFLKLLTLKKNGLSEKTSLFLSFLGEYRFYPEKKMEKERQPTPVFLPGECHGQRGLVGYSLWGCKELDTTKWLTHIHTHNGAGLKPSYTTIWV